LITVFLLYKHFNTIQLKLLFVSRQLAKVKLELCFLSLQGSFRRTFSSMERNSDSLSARGFGDPPLLGGRAFSLTVYIRL